MELKLAIVYLFLVGGTLGKGHMYTVMGINVHIYKIMENFDYGFPITLKIEEFKCMLYKFIDFNSEMPVQIFWSIQLSFQTQYDFLFPLLSYIILFLFLLWQIRLICAYVHP